MPGTEQNAVVEGSVVTTSTETAAETNLTSLEEALAHINKLNADKKALLDEKHQVKRKLSKFEEEAQQRDAALLTEQGKFKELYEQALQKATSLESKIKDSTVSSALKDILKENGARSVDTVLKLVDKTLIEFDSEGNINLDSVKSAVDQIKKADPILFGDVVRAEVPAVKRASEGAAEGSFDKEVAAARSTAELKQIMAKYAGKL